jgi:hypothetical protein
MMHTTDTLQPIRIEYVEEHIAPGKELEVYAASADHVRVLDVTQVGSEMRVRYVVLWENGARVHAGANSDGDA